MKTFLNALIFEPNRNLIVPYSFLDESYSIIRKDNLREGLKAFYTNPIDIVFISASFKPNRSLNILEAVKNKSKVRLIPIIFVVDLSNSLNFIPGTSWGGKIGIIDSFANEAQFVVTTDRILRLLL